MAEERLEELKARVPSEDAEQLRARAKQEGRAVAEVVRDAVTEYLGRRGEEDRVLAGVAKQGDRLQDAGAEAEARAALAAFRAPEATQMTHSTMTTAALPTRGG